MENYPNSFNLIGTQYKWGCRTTLIPNYLLHRQNQSKRQHTTQSREETKSVLSSEMTENTNKNSTHNLITQMEQNKNEKLWKSAKRGIPRAIKHYATL